VVVGATRDDDAVDPALARVLRGREASALHVPDGAEVERLLPEAGAVALVDADWIGHDHALRLVACDSRDGVRAAGGLLAAGASDAHHVRAAVRRAGSAAPEAVRAALEHAGVVVRDVVPPPLVSVAARDETARTRGRHSRDEVDEEQVRLGLAVKSSDGVFTTLAISPWTRHLARWAAGRGLTPDQVTWASVAVALLATAGFAVGATWSLVAGAVLLQLSFALDCTDGQLARYAVAYTARGAWLDAALDRVKEYVVYLGLAVGAARHGDDVWLLAGAATDRLDGMPLAEAARRVVALPIGERWLLISIAAALGGGRAAFVALLVAGWRNRSRSDGS
jgi:hypothetical protein